MAQTTKGKKATDGAKGHVRLVVQVPIEQIDGLRAEAEKRRKPGQIRADVSVIVRDAIAQYLARRAR